MLLNLIKWINFRPKYCQIHAPGPVNHTRPRCLVVTNIPSSGIWA